jgi:hypothetical protein
MVFAISISYRGLALPQFPVSDGTSPKYSRNADIRARHKKDEAIRRSLRFLASLSNVSGKSQIIAGNEDGAMIETSEH